MHVIQSPKSECGTSLTLICPSDQSSTYESIYEPTRARPGGQPAPVSGRGQYPLSGPFVAPGAQGLAPAPSSQPITNPDRAGREAEVDSLTSLLVHGLDNPQPDFFGESPPDLSHGGAPGFCMFSSL